MNCVTPKPYGRGHQHVPDTSERIETLRDALVIMGSEPAGPVYQGTNKQLADILLRCGNEEEAVYHLSESHGATLRNLTRTLINQHLTKKDCDQSDLGAMKERLVFKGEWHNGINGLFKRFSELPSDWTVVQLTLAWDQLSRFPPRNRDVNRGQGVHFTRFSCGKLATKKNKYGEGGKPLSIFLPPLDGNAEQISLMTAMRRSIAIMDSRVKVGRSRLHTECSQGIEATVRELETWIGGWHCLLYGRILNDNVLHAIKSAVDGHIASFNSNDTEVVENGDRKKQSSVKPQISEKVLSILYLLASSPSVTSKQILQVCSQLLEDSKFALYLSKNICDVIRSYSAALKLSKRGPVVLIIDEDMDILPFESMTCVEEQSFTRMPSIHFLHALYNSHKNSAIKNGIDLSKVFYVINPTKDLPKLDELFQSKSLKPYMGKWKGVFGACPSHEEFLAGLQENDLFLYCGHGGGNQFIPRDQIERALIKSVVFLFGCCSSSLEFQGGRVEMTSLSYSYLLAGSPCTVGMLWPVLDVDINAMTEALIKAWQSFDVVGGNETGSLEGDFKKMNLNGTKGKNGPVQDLSEAVSIARKSASRFLNRAAMVVRGLPVYSMSV